MRWILSSLLGVLVAPLASSGLLITEMNGKVEVAGQDPAKTLVEVVSGARLKLLEGARLLLVDLKSGQEFMLSDAGIYEILAGGPFGKSVLA